MWVFWNIYGEFEPWNFLRIVVSPKFVKNNSLECNFWSETVLTYLNIYISYIIKKHHNKLSCHVRARVTRKHNPMNPIEPTRWIMRTSENNYVNSQKLYTIASISKNKGKWRSTQLHHRFFQKCQNIYFYFISETSLWLWVEFQHFIYTVC